MKLQIDTKEKTIKIEESINISELINILSNMFPNDTWKEYKLCPVFKIEYWTNPITYTPLTPLYRSIPQEPCYPTITCSTDSSIHNLIIK